MTSCLVALLWQSSDGGARPSSTHPMSRHLLFLLAMLLYYASPTVRAQEAADRPALAVGDQWVMRNVDLWTGQEVHRLRFEIVQAEASKVTLLETTMAIKEGGSGGQVRRTMDPNTWTFDDAERGASSVNLAFPLVSGKKWTAEFKTPSGNPNYQIPHTRTASVEAWESVTVPAGTFKALRVAYVDRVMLFIGDGIFPAYIEERVWYVPAVKWYVKREEIVRNPLKKIETQFREELLEFRLGKP
jgi:hypothetical protein